LWCSVGAKHLSSVGDFVFAWQFWFGLLQKNSGFRASVPSQESPLLMAGVLKPVMLWPELYEGKHWPELYNHLGSLVAMEPLQLMRLLMDSRPIL